MESKIEAGNKLVAWIIALALLICQPLYTFAQAPNARSCWLDSGTPVALRTTEDFTTSNKAETGTIPAVVENDVYSSDGSIIFTSGTPATIEFNLKSNGPWGKPGKVCTTWASTRTIDHKNVMLRMSNCKKGESKKADVIILSILLFPFGLFSGFMTGTMPKIPKGTIYDTMTSHDVNCTPAEN